MDNLKNMKLGSDSMESNSRIFMNSCDLGKILYLASNPFAINRAKT